MKPFISIITVNYNGKKHLKKFLSSALALDYPILRYEVIVVDNGSQDESVAFISAQFPRVRVIQQKNNLGFGGGNNLGIAQAKGEYVFLVNNDTMLSPNILNVLMTYRKTWGRKKIGAYTTKLLLMDSYIPVKVANAMYKSHVVPSEWKAANPHIYNFSPDQERDLFEELYLPVSSMAKGSITLKLRVRKTGSNKFRARVGNQIIESAFEKGSIFKEIVVKVQTDGGKRETVDLIQNAGNFFFRDGSGRDRGALVYKNTQYYEKDHGQYEQPEVVPGLNAAGVLLSRQVLKQVGGFDTNFFMYYEDADLTLRLQEKGYGVLYCPKAVIRHIHAASSKEGSSFFLFNAERGRLLLVFKHWPIWIGIREWMVYFWRDTLVVPLYYLLHGEAGTALMRFSFRVHVNLSLILPFVASILNIHRLSKKQRDAFL